MATSYALRTLRLARQTKAAERVPLATDVTTKTKDLAARKVLLADVDAQLSEFDRAITALVAAGFEDGTP